jgi:hypothetical protein
MRSERSRFSERCNESLSLPGTGRGDHAKRGGWGPLSLESYEDRIDNADKVSIDFGIPETQHDHAGPGKFLVARPIVHDAMMESMSAAIDLDRDMVLQASKVENVSVARNLPAKVVSPRAQFAKANPKLHFLRGHGLAQPARLLVRHGTPPTALRAVPPPRTGEGLERVTAAPASLHLGIGDGHAL